MKPCFFLFFAFFVAFGIPLNSAAQEKVYVGSESCRDCHEGEYNRFMQYAKKAKSFNNIKKMKTKLTPEEFLSCFECHTTGYGKKGGFVSETETPALKNPGCEVCHGPGSLHVETEDPDNIIYSVSRESCTRCHNSERIEVFNFEPLLFGGAH